MQNQTSVVAAPQAASRSVAISKGLQLAATFLFGIVVLYGAGFAQISAAHNAAHDTRHSQGFPCH